MSLDQVVQKLKSARDITGLSLAQIQEKTKIPYNHLASIDAGNFDDLPEPVYVAGFIRRYAECVGLDAQELVQEYRSELDNASMPVKRSGLLFKKQKNNGNNMPSQNHYNRQRIEKTAPNLFKLIPFYALWIVLILVLIVYLVNRQGEIEQNQQDASLLTLKQSAAIIPPPKSITPNAADTTLHSDVPVESHPEVLPQASGETSPINIKAKNHVWVEVKAVSNGEALFNGFLEAGDSHDFSDKEGVRIRAGNAGNLVVTASGKTSDLGLAGKIAEKTFFSNKTNQTTEVQSNENISEPIPQKAISTVVNKQNTNAAKQPTDEMTATKKPSNETVASKKTVINSLPKQSHTIKDTLTSQSKAQNSESVTNSGNKAMDVPYRYSE